MTPADRGRRSHIHLRCDVCGNAMRVPRMNYDPDAAAECVTNGCDICHGNDGGWEETWYHDSDGAQCDLSLSGRSH